MLKFFVLSFFYGFPFLVWGQEYVVTGKVTQESGEALAGASVRVAGWPEIGCATDIKGEFHLTVPSEARYLLFSFVGMETRKMKIEEKMRITLKSRQKELDEILAVAYGNTRKSRFSGSAVQVEAKEWQQRPLTVVTHSLEGKVAGLQVAEGNGQPGSEVHLRIRGTGSVNAGNDPVYVLDGALFHGALCDINPQDIASLTVLKDAAATALYGSSAGNGVVLITTKSAGQGKPLLSFDMKQGFSERGIPEYERVNLWDYYPLQWEMLRNKGVSEGETAGNAALRASAEVFQEVKYNPFKGVPDDAIVTPEGRLNPLAAELLYGDDLDWEKALLRKGYRSEYHLSYQMRGEKGDLYASLGYLREKAALIASGLERFSGLLKGNFQPLKGFTTGLQLNVSRTYCTLANTQDNASDVANPFYFTRYIGPVYPIHRPGGEESAYDYEEAVRGTGISQLSHRNIVAETRSNRNRFERNGLNGRTYAEYRWRGFQATVNLAVDSYDYRRKQYENNVAASSPGRLSASDIRTTTLTFSQLLGYNRDWGLHQLSVLAGHESYSYRYEYLYGRKSDQFLNGVYDMYNFQTLGGLTSYTHLYRKEGYFFRAVYDYGRRYDVSFSLRRDGNSRFARAHRWGNFWSLGAAWNVGSEKFMEPVEFVRGLKVRASYGITGNDEVLQSTSSPNTFTGDYYPWQTLYKIGVNNASEPGIAFQHPGNAGLEWETQVSADVAVEFRLWKWLSGSVEYFQKNSRNLLFEVPQVLSSGTSKAWANVGRVMNRGVELEMQFRLLAKKYWQWEIAINGTFLKNEILEMPAVQPGIVNSTQKLAAGKSLYTFWLKEYRGVNPETGDVQYAFDGRTGKWNDRNCFVNAAGDSLTFNSTYARLHEAGSAMPKVYGGLSASLRYRNISLSAVLAYSLGGKVYNTGYQVLMYAGKYGQALHKDMLRRWQKPGDHTDVPRLDDANPDARTGLNVATQINAVSDRWLMSASYLNVTSVTLQYELPAVFLHRYGIQQAAVFISGENLYLWTAMKGLDPRQLYKGVISVGNPPSRMYTLGLSFAL